ncbi:MAG: MtrB/PioB family outer membrane beta-barrel protein [Opitutaceae bacterium]
MAFSSVRFQSLWSAFTLCAALPLAAQTSVDSTSDTSFGSDSAFWLGDQEEAVAPIFSEDELFDLGPQYLLIPSVPPHDWFHALIDFQYLKTSNPTLQEGSGDSSTDLFVLTAQFGVTTPKKKFLSGEWSNYTGVRYQVFRYGLSDRDEVIGGIPVENNDFNALSVFSDLYWNYELWQLRLGLRWTEFENDLNGSGFYNEIVPNWGVKRGIPISQNSILTVSYEGALYLTESTAFTFARDDLNDRFVNSLGASYLYRVSEKLYIEPSARVSYSVYDNTATGDREDTVVSIGVTASYYFNETMAIRVFGNHQRRNSTGLGISNYENTDIGLGGSLSLSF